MVHDPPRAAELRVLVLQGVVRVRVGGQDPPEVTLRDRVDVVLGEMQEQPFLADPPHVVPGVLLGFVEDSEVRPRLLEELCQGPCRALVPRVE